MFSPLPHHRWGKVAAAHLLDRAGFGGTPKEIERLAALGPAGAVDSLLNAGGEDELFPPPQMVDPSVRIDFKNREKAATTPEDRAAISKQLGELDRLSMLDLRLWWLNRMRYTSAPLLEKITLFWHGHFATSNQKVDNPEMMWFQNETLRQDALGKFPDMLKAISRDPAMLRWLDLEQSRKEHPNENFAREVMELFSLGEGNYTEKDIQESARAFTGYRIDYKTGSFQYVTKGFDDGQKTFFGQTGPFTGDQIIDMIVMRPQCAQFIGRKLWKFFVSDDPSETTVGQVAGLLLSNGYDIGQTLRTIFLSAEFYSPEVMHHQIKGPVQWLIQTTKMLEIPLPDAQVVENSMSALGQVVFAPPNVKGWDGGRAWISSSSLLYRYNLAAYLLSGKAKVLGSGGTKTAVIPLDVIAPAPLRNDADALMEAMTFRVFNVPLSGMQQGAYLGYLASHKTPYSDNAIRDLLQIMMCTPEYQLT